MIQYSHWNNIRELSPKIKHQRKLKPQVAPCGEKAST